MCVFAHCRFPSPRFKNQRGQTLVQLLVAVAISSIVMLTFADLITNQSHETRALTEKIGSLDLERALIAALANGNVCQYVLNHPVQTFDSTNLPQVITLKPPTPGTPPALYDYVLANGKVGQPIVEVGSAASPVAHSLVVKSIQLKVVSGSNANYSGEWHINFEPKPLVRPIAPVIIRTTLNVDDVTSPTAARVLACQSGVGANFLKLSDLMTDTFPQPPVGAISPTWACIGSADFPTSGGSNSPEILSNGITYTPVGTKLMISSTAKLAMHNGKNGYGAALQFSIYANQGAASLGSSILNNAWASAAALRGNSTSVYFGNQEIYTTYLKNVTPGVPLKIRYGLLVQCGEAIGNPCGEVQNVGASSYKINPSFTANTADACVAKKVFVQIQEFN